MRIAGLFLAGMLAWSVLTAEARADRVPSRKTVIYRARGVRPDISVPYVTNGRSALGVYEGVSPRIYSSPVINDPSHPQAKPVFNLQFWGSVQSFGGRSNGAVPRPPAGSPFPPYNSIR